MQAAERRRVKFRHFLIELFRPEVDTVRAGRVHSCLNNSNCPSTWSVKKHDIKNERWPVAQPYSSCRPEVGTVTTTQEGTQGQRTTQTRGKTGEIQGETVRLSAIGGVDLDPLEAHVPLSPILRKRTGEEGVAIRDNLAGDKDGGTNEGKENPTSPVPT